MRFTKKRKELHNNLLLQDSKDTWLDQTYITWRVEIGEYLSLLHKNIYFDACAIVRAINFCFDTWPIVLLCFDMTLMSLLERCVFKASVLTPCNSSSKIRHCYFLAASKTTQDHYTHWIQRDGVVVVKGCKNNISITSPGTHQGNINVHPHLIHLSFAQLFSYLYLMVPHYHTMLHSTHYHRSFIII